MSAIVIHFVWYFYVKVARIDNIPSIFSYMFFFLALNKTLQSCNSFFDRQNLDQVTCGNTTFSAHRGTLASRSDVFFTAFGSSFAEARTAKYDIKNSSPEAVEAMLYYMYTGHLKVKQETWFLNKVMRFVGCVTSFQWFLWFVTFKTGEHDFIWLALMFVFVATKPPNAGKSWYWFVWLAILRGHQLFWTAKEILADLLNLAAQYQLDDLITLVSKHLAAGVDEQNVVDRTKTLKLHQNREPCKIAFDSILKKVMDDSSQGLLRALVWNNLDGRTRREIAGKNTSGFRMSVCSFVPGSMNIRNRLLCSFAPLWICTKVFSGPSPQVFKVKTLWPVIHHSAIIKYERRIPIRQPWFNGHFTSIGFVDFLIGFAKILFITINNHHLIWYFLNISKHRGQANLRSMSNLTGHWAGPSLVFVREIRTSHPKKPSSFTKQNMGTTFNCSMFFVFFPASHSNGSQLILWTNFRGCFGGFKAWLHQLVAEARPVGR